MLQETFAAFLKRELRHFPGREKPVAIFEAYYDHSLTGSGDAETLTLACLVAPADRWGDFSTAWSAAMKAGGAAGKILHMKELVHGVGAFPGWKAEKQTALFAKLLPVIGSHVAWGVCFSFPMLYWHNTTVYNERRGHRFHPLFIPLQVAMESIMEDIKPTADNPVHSYMEEDHAVEADVTRQFYFLTKSFGWDQQLPLIRPLPKGPPPLQVADMVAYEGSRYCSEQCLAPSMRKPRALYRELCRFPQLHFAYMSLEKYRESTEATMVAGEQTRRNSPERIAEADRHLAAAAKRTQQERSAMGAERKKAKRRGR